MNKKILTMSIVFFVVVSMASVYAEGLISHDFGKFSMDIPNAPNGEIAEEQGEHYCKSYYLCNSES